MTRVEEEKVRFTSSTQVDDGDTKPEECHADFESYEMRQEPKCACCKWLMLATCLFAFATLQLLFSLFGIASAMIEFTRKHHNLTVWAAGLESPYNRSQLSQMWLSSNHSVDVAMSWMSHPEGYVGSFIFSVILLVAAILLVVGVKKRLARVVLAFITLEVIAALIVVLSIAILARLIPANASAAKPNKRFHATLIHIIVIDSCALVFMIVGVCCAIRMYKHLRRMDAMKH